MIVYADLHEHVQPLAVQDRLDALGRLVATCDDPWERKDALLELLIEAGRFEQAVDDATSPACDSCIPAFTPVRHITDTVADVLARGEYQALNQRHDFHRCLAQKLAAVTWHSLPAPLTLVAPEGYLVYGLTPLAYAATAAIRLRRLQQQTSWPFLMVIGVRSIGTSLSAMILATARQMGWTGERMTMRPRGNPLARHINLNDTLRQQLRDAAQWGALFLVVDEGPGLSGSSLAAVASVLTDECGVANHQVILMSAHGYPRPGIAPACQSTWMRHQVWALDPDTMLTNPRHVADTVAHLTGIRSEEVVVERNTDHLPAFHPLLVAPHYRIETHRGEFQAWFTGLGYIGRCKARRAAELANAGFLAPLAHAPIVDPVAPGWSAAYAQGFVVQQAKHSTMHHSVRSARPSMLSMRLLDYYTTIARSSCGLPLEQSDWTAITNLIEINTRAWFGSSRDDLLALLPAWRTIMSRAPRAAIDGQPQACWWSDQQRGMIKMGFAGGWMDHRAGRIADLALDIAGVLAEWEMPAWAAEALQDRIVRHTGDLLLPQRLPLAALLYAAAELGYFDHAYHCWGEADTYHHERQQCDIARRRAAHLLDNALKILPSAQHALTDLFDNTRSRDAVPCAS